MIRRVGAVVLIGVVMAGCGGPGGTVKVDGDEYAKAVKATESLARDATELVRETAGGTDGDISDVQSQQCGEAYDDHYRKLLVGGSFLYDGTSSEADLLDSVTGDLAERGWKKTQGDNERYFFEHGIPGGATLKLRIGLEPNYDGDQDVARSVVDMTIEGTCMDIPEDVAEKT